MKCAECGNHNEAEFEWKFIPKNNKALVICKVCHDAILLCAVSSEDATVPKKRNRELSTMGDRVTRDRKLSTEGDPKKSEFPWKEMCLESLVDVEDVGQSVSRGIRNGSQNGRLKYHDDYMDGIAPGASIVGRFVGGAIGHNTKFGAEDGAKFGSAVAQIIGSVISVIAVAKKN